MRRVEQGLILAAGRGTRLYPLSGVFPKPLHPVCNKPIMQYQIEAMQAAGIEDIAIVIGPGGGAIRAFFGTGERLGVRMSYIEDPSPSGIAASLACAEAWARGPFAVFLGDIFLAIDDIGPALEPLGGNCAGTIVVRRDTPAAVRRNFAVLTNPAGQVTRVIEKPADPPTDLKGCGVYVFDKMIFEAIRRTPRSALRGEYEITDAVQILVDMGRPVYASDVVRWDVNITYPEDLLDCNLRVLRERYGASLIGSQTHIHTSARLASSIVGDGGRVEEPVVLEECLVLPGGRVSGIRANARRHIFGDGLIWAAEQQRAVGG